MGLDELRSRLEAIQDGLSQVMDLSTRPHDVRIDRSIDYDQHNSMTINQNAQGQAATGTWHRLWKELSTEAADARPI